jgi:hypothetical protein
LNRRVAKLIGMPLSTRERAILDLERDWWTRPGSKEQAIRGAVKLSPTRYYALLNELIESAEALDYDPLVVLRLRRGRDLRRRARWDGRPMGGAR